MSGSLRCYSFHSVKGGVGKSTLSVLTALGLAQRGDRRVTLIDMDLTGTSLADVLPLESPACEAAPDGTLSLLRSPTGFHSREDTRQLMEERDEQAREAIHRGTEARAARCVPFLNDYLLFATPDWDNQQDLPIESVLWRMRGFSPENSLRVLPSSALPVDLERIIPVVFDENHSGFLESRLEYLLDALVPEQGEAVVVVDTPPTIPGLSRSVLSLALRLSAGGGTEKVSLSLQGGLPPRLKDAPVTWTAFLVGSLDRQDLRAANRWLSLVKEEERRHIRFLANRVGPGDKHEIREQLNEILAEQANRILLDATLVHDDPAFQLFRSDALATQHWVVPTFLEKE